MPSNSLPDLQIWNAPSAMLDAPFRTATETTPEKLDTERIACREMWRSVSQRKRTDLEPLTLAWFEWVEHRRYARQGSWLSRRMEFRRHGGDKILCLGHGLGSDWVQYAAHGAQVTVLHPVADQLALVRRNFEVRQLAGQWLQGSFAALPQRDNSMDIVCLSAIDGPVDAMPDVIAEIYRVLRPGGKVLSILPAWYNVRRWKELCLPWNSWFRRSTSRTREEPRYSARDLRQMFGDFSEHRLYQRHLRRSDLPHLWRWLPLPLMERIMGKYLLLKAFKPLSSALTIAAAA